MPAQVVAAMEGLLDQYGRQHFVLDDLDSVYQHSGRVEITLPMRPLNLLRPPVIQAP